MHKHAILVPLAALALAAAVPAGAHRLDAPIDQRQARQHVRIAEGVHAGTLTRHEARVLAAEQAAIHARERRYRADGRLAAWERADLTRHLDAASRHIARQAHDRQRRAHYAPW